MADTKRQKLVDAVIARMQMIRVSNGYATDAGQRVEDWPRRFDEAELRELSSKAALAVCDIGDDSEKADRESALEVHELSFQVRIFVTTDTPARELRKIIGDVQSALGVDQYWSTLGLGTNPRRAGMIVPKDSMEIAGAAVEFDIGYLTETFNPYQ